MNHTLLHAAWSLFIACLLTGAGTHADGVAEDTLQQVRATGEGATKTEALQEACRDAVSQVAGALIIGETTIEDGQLIKDKIIAFSNGNVESLNVIESRKVGTGEDAYWTMTIDADVHVYRILNELKVNNINAKTEIDSSTFSLLGKQLSEEERALTAAMTLDELMRSWPQCVWRIEPTGELRKQRNRTSAGEIVVAHKVRFSLDKDKWATFSVQLNRMLNEIATEQETIRLKPSRLTMANTSEELRGIPSSNGSCYHHELKDRVDEEMGLPAEERIRRKIKVEMGRISIDTSTKNLRTWRPRTEAIQQHYKIGFEDTIVVLDRKLREAKVYAVPPEAWDSIARAFSTPPEIYITITDPDENDIGQPMFDASDCILQLIRGKNDEKWGVRKFSHLRLTPQAMAPYETDAPRCIIFSPFLGMSAHKMGHWLGTSVDIEYPFAMTEEDMATEGLTFEVEVVATDTP